MNRPQVTRTTAFTLRHGGPDAMNAQILLRVTAPCTPKSGCPKPPADVSTPRFFALPYGNTVHMDFKRTTPRRRTPLSRAVVRRRQHRSLVIYLKPTLSQVWPKVQDRGPPFAFKVSTFMCPAVHMTTRIFAAFFIDPRAEGSTELIRIV